MKTLGEVTPTSEQLPLISNPRPGVQVIRGAAGSGKTTTALLMLKQLTGFWVGRKRRQGITDDINILVLTYNRTLKAYIEELAKKQITNLQGSILKVYTFGKWGMDLKPFTVISDELRENKIVTLSSDFDFRPEFVIGEVDYILGRFTKDTIPEYLKCKRDGRGTSPAMGKELRQKFLDQVVYPYIQWKDDLREHDWNDLALGLLEEDPSTSYQIIVADEVQDLSANQIKAIMHYADDPSSIVFVMDTAQRIYPRGFNWAEAGVDITHDFKSYRLKENHRNTKEICHFALPLLNGLTLDDDGTFPDFSSCSRSGDIPSVLKGKFNEQVTYVIDYIHSNVNIGEESIAFIHPLGGRWFDYLKGRLIGAGLDYVVITRQSEWPTGPENIALSTMHSAKGLEFDHVFVLGLNDKVTPHGAEEGDSTFENLRRMLAMSITRAKESVILGYKPGEASDLLGILDPDTYNEIEL
jgi:superfamily I DNA/RNA helicase